MRCHLGLLLPCHDFHGSSYKLTDVESRHYTKCTWGDQQRIENRSMSECLEVLHKVEKCIHVGKLEKELLFLPFGRGSAV